MKWNKKIRNIYKQIKQLRKHKHLRKIYKKIIIFLYTFINKLFKMCRNFFFRNV